MRLRYCLILIFFLYPTPVAALSLTELAYDVVGADSSHEWVEIFNDSDQPRDLTGLVLFDGSRHQLVPPPGKGGQGTMLLAPQAYAILADDAATFLSDYPNYQGSVIDTVLSLPNYSTQRTESVMVQILDGNQQLLSEVGYIGTKKGSQGYTWERQADGAWTDSGQAGGTPGQAPGSVSETAPLGTLRLSEIFPNPAGKDDGGEWVEIEHLAGPPVDLSDWYLTDLSGSKLRLPETVTLSVGHYFQFLLKGSPLNNESETLSLYDPFDQLVDSIQFERHQTENLSLSRFGEEWQWTSQLTPNTANQLKTPSEPTSSQRSSASAKVTAKSSTTQSTSSSKNQSPSTSRLSPQSTSSLSARTATGASQAQSSSGRVAPTATAKDGRAQAILSQINDNKHSPTPSAQSDSALTERVAGLETVQPTDISPRLRYGLIGLAVLLVGLGVIYREPIRQFIKMLVKRLTEHDPPDLIT